MENTCKNCKWFDDGDCKRYPPTTIVCDGRNGDEICAYYPEVSEIDFCGEYELMEKIT